ncbi:MAG: hypothetical protein Q7J98_07085 [Kiritimatiellia bacterium]|nr:hypothetical protein [Kiritimatiellia bacterium]
MKQFASIISYALILVMFLITALSCSKKPNEQKESLTAPSPHQQTPAIVSSNEGFPAESTRILMEQDKNTGLVIQLISKGDSYSKKPNEQEESITVSSTSQRTSATVSSNEGSPTASTQILMEEEDENSVVLRLIGEGDNGIWRLRDDQNEIQVKRIDSDIFDIQANGENWQVNSQIKATPGERVVIASIGNRTLSLELPLK